MMRLLLLSVLVVMLSACSELQYYSSDGFAPVIDRGRGVNNWLNELHETRAMSPELLQQTQETWEKEFRTNPSLNNRMRLALLLAAGEEPVRDHKRARKLLQGVDPEAINDTDQELVNVLQQYLEEQGQAQQKITILWQQVTEQSRRIEELEQQLEALTAIEQNIQQREKPGGD